MHKIKAIIVDDEPGNVTTLVKMLEMYCTNVELLGVANNIEQAATLIHKLEPDLLLLDIEMPNGSGFDLLNNLAPINFEVIFVTAFNDYAIQAFKYSAIDYILKPVSIVELKNAIARVKSRLENQQLNQRVDYLLNNLKTDSDSKKKVGLPTIDGIIFEEVDNIMYLEADNNYTNVFFKDKKKELVSKSIADIEELLPKKTFCRVHRSYLININYVKKYFKGRGGYVVMDDEKSIEISSRKKEELFKLL